MTRGIEREAKLTAPDDVVLPDLDGVVAGVVAAPATRRELDAVYYDCADLRLARSGVTLRYRSGDDGQPWTLKLPAGRSKLTLARRELGFHGPGQRMPSAARDLVRAYRRSGRLRPVARLHTDRTVVVLSDGSGAVAEVCDDRVSASGRGAFREIEVELCDGSGAASGLLSPVVGRLVNAGCRADPPVPKLVRALGERARTAPDLHLAELDGQPSASHLIRHALAVGAARMVEHDAGVRLGEDPEDVHQFRVATRRLRSDLQTFAVVLDPDWVRSLRERLRWLGAEVGAVRDHDVLTERLRTQAGTLCDVDDDGVDLLLEHLAEQGRRARTRMLAALRAARYDSLLDDLVAAAHEPRFIATDAGAADAPARPLVLAVVRRQWRHLRRGVHVLGERPSDADLHRVRILVKRCRYATEAAIPALSHRAGVRATELAAALADAQSVLGDQHDALVAEEWLRASASDVPGCALVAGQLVTMQRGENERLRERWPAAWRATSAERLRSWL